VGDNNSDTATYYREWTHDGRPELHRRGVEPISGPWDDEPDKVHWIDADTDLDCLIVRGPSGSLCGYVAVPPGHPWHGLGYGSVDVHVHGGLTFADSCHESTDGEGHGICHVPLPGRPHDVWWLGFDCAHAFDVTPYWASLEAHEPSLRVRVPADYRGAYRTLDYVKNECRLLARQVAEAAS
jgi:hypothetical protein